MLDIQSYANNSKTIICIKDTEGKVLYQNSSCVDYCGQMSQESDPCSKNCMTFYIRDLECQAREEGTQYFPCQLLGGKYYDIFFVNDGNTLMSIMYPLEKRINADLEFFSQFNLTPREMDIISLIIGRALNKEICEQLGVSPGTLKTHLHNLYKKLPEKVADKLKTTYRKG